MVSSAQSINGFDKFYPWAIFIHNNELIEHEKVERFIIIFHLLSEISLQFSLWQTEGVSFH